MQPLHSGLWGLLYKCYQRASVLLSSVSYTAHMWISSCQNPNSKHSSGFHSQTSESPSQMSWGSENQGWFVRMSGLMESVSVAMEMKFTELIFFWFNIFRIVISRQCDGTVHYIWFKYFSKRHITLKMSTVMEIPHYSPHVGAYLQHFRVNFRVWWPFLSQQHICLFGSGFEHKDFCCYTDFIWNSCISTKDAIYS